MARPAMLDSFRARVPIASARPLLLFASIRLAMCAGGLVIAAVLGFPYGGPLAATLGGAAVPWALFVLYLARRRPEAALHPLVAAGDLLVLLLVEVVVPETYAVVRFAALFFIAVHSHLQGGDRSLVVGALASLTLTAGTLVRGDHIVGGDLLAFYESGFVVAAVGTGLLVGRLRSTESASRLQARSLTRHTIEAEREVRRRVAESIHDGPVQDLIGLDMVLAAARSAAERGDAQRAGELIGDAHEITERNVRALRDEIVDLGPYAFEELTYEAAVDRCVEAWRRRYGMEVALQIERVELPGEVAADLFHITQEAVANAGRHAQADTVSVVLRSVDGRVELRVADDGKGFDGTGAFELPEPGHLGLASIRQRAELLDAELSIESSERGTRLLVQAPLPRRVRIPRRRSAG